MLDCHCHLDQYKNPKATAKIASEKGVFIIAMTNLPSHFLAGLPHVKSLSKVRLALGLHPLAKFDQAQERNIFRSSVNLTSFIGEVGLDFSPENRITRDTQLDNFHFVAKCISNTPKILSVHSRGAESAVIDILSEHKIPFAIFHWFSGSMNALDQALSSGSYFSINPAMIKSKKCQRIIDRIPQDRLLTESDGPFIQVGRRTIQPWDISIVHAYLSRVWNIKPEEVQSHIWSNFRQILNQLGKHTE